MLMVVDLEGTQGTFQQIAERLAEVGRQTGVMISIQRMDLFAAMHRV